MICSAKQEIAQQSQHTKANLYRSVVLLFSLGTPPILRLRCSLAHGFQVWCLSRCVNTGVRIVIRVRVQVQEQINVQIREQVLRELSDANFQLLRYCPWCCYSMMASRYSSKRGRSDFLGSVKEALCSIERSPS